MPKVYKPITASLRARLLVLTILFVMVVEAVIYLPSVANFRQTYLNQRMENAQIAALALVAAPNQSVSVALERSLLNNAGVIAVVLQLSDQSLLLGFDLIPSMDLIDATYDLRNPSLGELIMDAVMTLRSGGERVIQVTGASDVDGARRVQITMDEAALYAEMARYSNNVLLLSLVVSIFTGVLIYLTLHWLVVRPLKRLSNRIMVFREHPERIMPEPHSATRKDEIGLIARELGRMQHEIRQSFQQQSRLAALGEAVSKINHDLRNILATAQLASDSLARNEDPKIQKTAGRLMSAVGRAVALCERTMKFGSAQEPEPDITAVNLHDSVSAVFSSLEQTSSGDLGTAFINLVDKDIMIAADDEQFHRVMLNLTRNAVQAQGGQGLVEVSAQMSTDDLVHIRLRDEGPGIPEPALPGLFKAFNTSSKVGGTGLGLAISREIILAHGGRIGLEKTGPEGTCFMICMPKAET